MSSLRPTHRLHRSLLLPATLALCVVGCGPHNDAGEPDPARSAHRLDPVEPSWSFVPPRDHPSERYLTLPALGDDGTVYVASWNGSLYALAPDGTERWSLELGGRLDASPAVGDDGTVYVAGWSGALHAVAPDGTERWSFTTGAPIDNSPTLGADGTIYVASEDQTLYAVDSDGAEQWTLDLGAAPTTAASVRADGSLVLGSADGRLHCIASDGTRQDTATLEGHATADVALDADGVAHVGTTTGRMAAVDADCALLWQENLTYAVLTAPVLPGDGAVVSGGHNDQIYALSKSDGQKRWVESTRTRAPFHTAPTVGDDGRLYGAADGLVVATSDGEVSSETSRPLLGAPIFSGDGAAYATDATGALLRYDTEDLGGNLALDPDAPWPTQHGDARRTGRGSRP